MPDKRRVPKDKKSTQAASRIRLVMGLVALAVLVRGAAPPAVPQLPATPAPLLVPVDGSASADQLPAPTQTGLARALDPLLEDPALGARVSAVVMDVATQQVMYGKSVDIPMVPASTTKLATAVAALAALGPEATLDTRVVRGPQPDEIVLQGGGDSTLALAPGPLERIDQPESLYPASAKLAELAVATARSLSSSATGQSPHSRPRVRLYFDDSRFLGPAVNPLWDRPYVAIGSVAPVTALMVDEGRISPDKLTRSADPSRVAAQAFAALLRQHGVTVVAAPAARPAAPDAAELARVSSPPMAALVERMLVHSDNDLAEALARQVALAERMPATFRGGGQAILRVLERLEIPTSGMVLYDGSGLSRGNRISAATLGQLLAVAASAEHPELRAAITGLPTAGFTGTLHDRFADGNAPAAAGVARAKTGSLIGASTLAGLVRDADGRMLVFAFLADQMTPSAAERARDVLDELAATVAACGCR